MAGKFELFKDSGGQFRFRLRARNGEIIASSESSPKALLETICMHHARL